MKRKHSVGYFSSYDRGLECLLNMWPKIREQVPDATLDIYYGWATFDKVHSNNPEQMRWKWGMVRKMNELDGVTEHGRVDHQTLAKAMKEIEVWAYPTEFTEIHCITALKAAEAGCKQITTGVAALRETARYGVCVGCTDIYTNEEKQDKFIQEVALALNDDKPFVGQVENAYWPDVAKAWHEAMS